jgi:tungstate transport system substrate-binding protein
MARARHLQLHLKRCAAIAMLATAAAAGCSRGSEPVILATTSSVANSGLLDVLLAAYDGRAVRPVLVGSGRALEMLGSGSADVAISHAPAREAAALARHPSWDYRKILYNDFVIVGPREDPAHVAGATGAVEAMARIARSGARFLSRGDQSGTHEREEELWQAAGVQPDASRVVVAGAGMGQTLRIAGSSGAYTLTDRGTYEALRNSVQLVVLHEGDPRLVNTYAVIADPGNEGGSRFARWLSDGAGREVLSALLRGHQLKGFLPWPPEVDRFTPDARPR